MGRDEMAEDKLILFKRLQDFRKKKGGKAVYDLAKALGHSAPHRAQRRFAGDQIVREICERRDWGPQEVAVIVAEISKRIEKKGLKILEPGDDPRGVVWVKDVFGDVRQFERMSEEITTLVLKGEVLDKHSRRLQRKYHLYPDKLAKPGVPQAGRNLLVKDHWEWIANRYKAYTPEEKRLELEAREFYEKCRRRSKAR